MMTTLEYNSSACVNLSLVDLQFQRDLEREEQFVFLEDASTAVVVHVVSVRLRYVTQSFHQIRVRKTLM